MIFAVEWQGETVGTVQVHETEHRVQFDVDCIVNSNEILRCYGICHKEPLLIGVLEPYENRLRCTKTFTKQSLQEYHQQIPQKYKLATGVLRNDTNHIITGDAILDSFLCSGVAQVEETIQGLRIWCTFDCNRPFGLLFAAAGCTIEYKENVPIAVLVRSRLFYKI